MLRGNAKFSMTLGYMTSLADTKHIFTERLVHLWRIEFCIWLRPRAVHVIHARKEIINSLRSRPSAARFARINCLPIISLTFTDSCRRAANMNKTGCIFHFFSRAKTNSTSWPAPNVWGEVSVAQLVEHCSANAGAMGSNPVELPTFLSGLIGNCLNCNYHCNDHVFT